MGYYRDHAIVVSSYYGDSISDAHIKATDLFGFGRVSQILDGGSNGCRSFFVSPDGSKEGWETSRLNDYYRESFKKYLKNFNSLSQVDGYLSWVEVQFADDDGVTKVLDSDCSS